MATSSCVRVRRQLGRLLGRSSFDIQLSVLLQPVTRLPAKMFKEGAARKYRQRNALDHSNWIPRRQHGNKYRKITNVLHHCLQKLFRAKISFVWLKFPVVFSRPLFGFVSIFNVKPKRVLWSSCGFWYRSHFSPDVPLPERRTLRYTTLHYTTLRCRY